MPCTTVAVAAVAAQPTRSTPPSDTRETAPGRAVTFTLRADADPGVLPRALELFAKRGLIPVSLRGELAGDFNTLAVEIEVVGMARHESDHVANCLRTIPMVGHVLVSERMLAGG